VAYPQFPELTEEDRNYIDGSQNVQEALFELSDAMRFPLTNNMPRFKDGDPEQPIFEVATFIEEVVKIFTDQGWTPPSKIVANNIET
jgi:hypothetical protein